MIGLNTQMKLIMFNYEKVKSLKYALRNVWPYNLAFQPNELAFMYI